MSAAALLFVSIITTGFAPQEFQEATLSTSITWEDYDADGLVDALAVAPTGELRLLKNTGHGAFEDVASDAGLAAVRNARFGLWHDYDGDGQLDLFVGTGRGPSYLFRNRGEGVFEDVTVTSSLTAEGMDRSAQWIDYDGDGLLDLHVETTHAHHVYHALGDGLFEPAELGLPRHVSTPIIDILAGARETRETPQPGPASGGETRRVSPSGRRVPPDISLAGLADSAPLERRSGGPGTSMPISIGSVTPLTFTCTPRIQDLASGACLSASSTPMLGTLYPLGQEFNIDGAGNVGIGTTTPSANLEVAGDLKVDTDALFVGRGINNDPVVGIGTTAPVGASTTLVVGDNLPGVGPVSPHIVIGGGSGNGTASLAMGKDSTGFMSVTWLDFPPARARISAHGSDLVLQSITGDGNVGIGSTVIGGLPISHKLTVESSFDSETVRLIGPGSPLGEGSRLNFGDGDFVYIDEPVDDFMEIEARLGVTVTDDFTVSGVKAFVNPHPADPSKEIRFACLEGNESGTYFRGASMLIDGRAVIPVPEEFRLVTEEEGMTVVTTPVGAPALLWIESIGLERIIVRSNVDVEFHYMVNGLRRGFADFEPIQENRHFIPQVAGVPYRQDQWPAAYLQILVEGGVLNSDLTPNEDTAAAMGWSLRAPTQDDLRNLEALRSKSSRE